MQTTAGDPLAALRTRGYVSLLVLAAVLGAPISGIAYGFLVLANLGQTWIYRDLPRALGLGNAPLWWPVPWLVLAGIATALVIRYLPGRGGHSPADGLHVRGSPSPAEIPVSRLRPWRPCGWASCSGPRRR